MPTCPFCSREVPAASSICPSCLRALPISVTTARPSAATSATRTALGWLRPAILVLALLAVGGYGFREYRQRRSVAEPVLTTAGEAAPRTGPVTTTIAPPIEVAIADSASVSIPAGGHLAFTFSGKGRSGCRVHGAVQALSRGDRRIAVFVVDRDGLAEVEGGRRPRTYYDSGVVSDVTLDINLDGRTEYTLVIANAGGGRRPKPVRIKSVRASCAD
ncbi:MAG: hypothetical protein JWN79_3119 [Gemmatimonadetes bacterium]|jgi:hypothetical protein|nr:hypothetical protein [Gemmatimonadota bacterium]